MNVYVWRHNKTYHSHSMIDEPCLNSEFYLDAVAIVIAENLDQAISKLIEKNKGWRADDLRALPCQIFPADQAAVVFSELRGTIQHL